MVTILMATYNGEKYICQQLDSILNQTYRKFKLIIRDDGSIDDTVTIIKNYIKKDNRISLIEGINVGLNANFAILLKKAVVDENSKIMFCDQDDVWLPEKIEISLNVLNALEDKYGHSVPLLVYCNRQYVDAENRYMNFSIDYKTDNLWSLLAVNNIYGCTMMFNYSLGKMLIPMPSYVYVYDAYVALMAGLFGKIKFINKKLIRYRQHKQNFTGGMNNFSIINKLKNYNRDNMVYEKYIKQSYCFCKSNYEQTKNIDLIKFIHVFEAKPILRVLLAIKLKLRIDCLKQWIRFLWVLGRCEYAKNEIVFVNEKEIL